MFTHSEQELLKEMSVSARTSSGWHEGGAARNGKGQFPTSEFSQVRVLMLFPSKTGHCRPAPILYSSGDGPPTRKSW